MLKGRALFFVAPLPCLYVQNRLRLVSDSSRARSAPVLRAEYRDCPSNAVVSSTDHRFLRGAVLRLMPLGVLPGARICPSPPVSAGFCGKAFQSQVSVV